MRRCLFHRWTDWYRDIQFSEGWGWESMDRRDCHRCEKSDTKNYVQTAADGRSGYDSRPWGGRVWGASQNESSME